MTATELDLATLLLKDRILIHNLLVDDAREFTMDAQKAEDIGDDSNAKLLNRLAKSRADMANKIMKLDRQITNEMIDSWEDED